jgi:5-methylcytosine-specific restriction endonuclease McrA
MGRTFTISRIGRYLARRDGGWFCHYCGCEIHSDPASVDTLWKPRQATVDHKTPLCRGGADVVTNLVLACKSCNDEKDAKDYIFFRAMTLQRREKQRRKRGAAV